MQAQRTTTGAQRNHDRQNSDTSSPKRRFPRAVSYPTIAQRHIIEIKSVPVALVDWLRTPKKRPNDPSDNSGVRFPLKRADAEGVAALIHLMLFRTW